MNAPEIKGANTDWVASGAPEHESSLDSEGNDVMKLKMLFAMTCMSLFSVAAWADPTCSSVVGETYDMLAATGCMESFANYSISIDNFTAISPVGEGASIRLSQVDLNSSTGLLGFQFAGDNASLPAFSNLGFTATITCTAGYTCGIVADYEQASFLQMGNSTTGLVTVTADAGASSIFLTPTSSTYGPSGFPDVSSFTESASYDGANILGNFETDLYSTSALSTPEPASILLFGTCVLGLGFLKRRAARKS